MKTSMIVLLIFGSAWTAFSQQSGLRDRAPDFEKQMQARFDAEEGRIGGYHFLGFHPFPLYNLPAYDKNKNAFPIVFGDPDKAAPPGAGHFYNSVFVLAVSGALLTPKLRRDTARLDGARQFAEELKKPAPRE